MLKKELRQFGKRDVAVMDRIERKARELMRVRENRICGTCKNNLKSGCKVAADKNCCIYNDYELWKPSSTAFYKLAERVLDIGG